MIINIHAGHNPDGKTAHGAIGLIRESSEARIVKDKAAAYLKAAGHTVYDCTVDDGNSQSDVLSKIVQKCNAKKADLDISIHFNAGRYDPAGDGANGGAEVWILNAASKAAPAAKRICEQIAMLGFKNRGVKTSRDLYVLRKTNAPALLVECCFVDDADDVRLYQADAMARAIADGILNSSHTPAKDHPSGTANPHGANGSLPDISFRVKVTVSALNIRSGPGTDCAVTGCIRDHGVYTITQTLGNWGKLKSGAGWINISNQYVKRV